MWPCPSGIWVGTTPEIQRTKNILLGDHLGEVDILGESEADHLVRLRAIVLVRSRWIILASPREIIW